MLFGYAALCCRQLPAVCYSKSLRKDHTITMTWALPPMLHLYRVRAEEYVSHLIGHEVRVCG